MEVTETSRASLGMGLWRGGGRWCEVCFRSHARGGADRPFRSARQPQVQLTLSLLFMIALTTIAFAPLVHRRKLPVNNSHPIRPSQPLFSPISPPFPLRRPLRQRRSTVAAATPRRQAELTLTIQSLSYLVILLFSYIFRHFLVQPAQR